MIIIKKAEIKDAKDISNLLKKTWKETYTFIPNEVIEKITNEWHKEESLKNQILHDKVIFNNIFYDEKLAGIISLKKISLDEYYLARLYVLSEFQGKGLGSLLFNNFVNFYKPKKIILEVEKENQKAQDFYINKGFTATGEKEDLVFGFLLKTIVMEKVSYF